MTARSPSAYALSAFLHASAAVLVALAFLLNGAGEQETPKVMELVAGAGDDYGATVAPALGSPEGIKVSLPGEAPPAPAPPPEAPPSPMEAAPAAPVAETSPITPAPAETAAPKKRARAKTPPTFSQVLKRTAAHREARLVAKFRKQMAEERRRESYAEFEREQAAAGRKARIDAEGIREGVVGGSTANATGGAGGRALTREEGDLLDAYFALLKSKLFENYDTTAANGDKLSATIEFYIAADGALGRPRIVRSSGNGDFDRAVLDAFQRTGPIGPRPDHRGETVRLVFDLKDAEE